MKIAQIPPNANSPAPPDHPRECSICPPRAKPVWDSNLDNGSCFAWHVSYGDGRVKAKLHPCRRLDCPNCGPRKRKSEWQTALAQFAMEQRIYVTYIPAWMWDRLRKYINDQGFKAKRVPVAEHYDAIFTTVKLDGWKPRKGPGLPPEASHEISDEEVARLFLEYRVNKRHLRNFGAWNTKKKARPVQKPADYVEISRNFVTGEAVRSLAQLLKRRYHDSGEEIVLNDVDGRGGEYFKQQLIYEEKRLRIERLAAIGHVKRKKLWRMLPLGR